MFSSVLSSLRASQWCTDRKVNIQLAVVLLFVLLYNVAKVVMLFGSPILLISRYALIIILDAIFMLILPTRILALLNIRLMIALRAHRRMQAQNQSSQNEDSTTFVLVIIVVVLIVCQLPRIAFPVLMLTLPLEMILDIDFFCSLLPLSNVLVVFNSAVNFFIYIFFNKAFSRRIDAASVQAACTTTNTTTNSPTKKNTTTNSPTSTTTSSPTGGNRS